jgi:cyclic beta-1,2-glucan synthetase
VENPQGIARGVLSVELDGAALATASMQVQLVDDGAAHHVRVILGARDKGRAAES